MKLNRETLGIRLRQGTKLSRETLVSRSGRQE